MASPNITKSNDYIKIKLIEDIQFIIMEFLLRYGEEWGEKINPGEYGLMTSSFPPLLQ